MVPVWALVCTSVCNGVRCFYLSQQRMESTHIFIDYFFNRFLSTLVYVEVVYVCLQIETIVGFLHLRFFCLHLLLLFFFCKCAYSPEFTYSLLLIWQLELELVDVLCNLFKIPYLSY